MNETTSSWLRSLRLGNFKAIGKTQTIPLRPITLVFGPNSAGKSSLLHGLLLAHHAMHSRAEAPLDTHRVELGGESVDLGGFKQYVHRHLVSSVVSWGTEITIADIRTNPAYGKSNPLRRLCEICTGVEIIQVDLTWGVETDDIGHAQAGAIPRVISYDLTFDGVELLRASKRPEGGLRIDAISHDHSVIAGVIEAALLSSTTTIALTDADKAAINEAVVDILDVLSVETKGFLPNGIKRPEDEGSASPQQSFFPVSRASRAEDLSKAVKFWLPRILNELLHGVHEAVTMQFARMKYLGPLRSYPPRHLAFAENHDLNWYAGGGHAWDVVLKNDAIREKVNSWLSNKDRLQTPYRLEIRQHTTLETLRALLTNAIEQEQAKPDEMRNDISVLEAKLEAEEADLQTLTELDQTATELAQLRDEIAEYDKKLPNVEKELYGADLNAQRYDDLIAAKSEFEKARIDCAEKIVDAEVTLKHLTSRLNSSTLRRREFDIKTTLLQMEEKINSDRQRLEQLQERLYEKNGDEDVGEDASELADRLFNNILATDPETLRELSLLDLRSNSTVSHRDVGIGVSQVLPVLVGAYAGEGQILLVEQPEIHLHPRLQAELGDVFIESALGPQRNTFVLETHSEHLILRLMRRMRNTSDGELPEGIPPVRPEDIAILYVLPQESGESVILNLRIDRDGAILDPWPGGFFEEGFRERFA